MSENFSSDVLSRCKEVFSANYPEADIDKISATDFRAFLLHLFHHTSKAGQAGAKTVSSIDVKNKSKRTPSEVLIQKSLDRQGRTTETELRKNLRRLVIRCSDFFYDYKQQWIPSIRLSRKIDENFISTRIKGRKRKIQDKSQINKIRKTLLPVENQARGDELQCQKTPYVSLARYLPVEAPKNQTLPSKSEFLGILKLSLNNNGYQQQTQVPNSTRLIKLQNCPHIPLSSEVGKLILQRENHNIPDYARDRKMERLEWYVNTEIPLTTKYKYEVDFSTPKSSYSHVYKFPKKQYHQMHGNQEWFEFLKKKCSPLSIVVNNENLLGLKRRMEMFKIKATGSKSKMPGSKECIVVLERYLRQEDTVVLINKSKELKVVLIDCGRRQGLRPKESISK